jgi:hypothetical protein
MIEKKWAKARRQRVSGKQKNKRKTNEKQTKNNKQQKTSWLAHPSGLESTHEACAAHTI